MGQTILVANRNAEETQAIMASLGTQFATQSVLDMAGLNHNIGTASALVLDTNFSDSQGVDVLMDVLARERLPVLMLTPADDPSCAIEALRCGATHYLVKAGTYVETLPMAVQEIMVRAHATQTLKAELAQLRQRNGELEKQVATASRVKAGGSAARTLQEPASANVSMEEIIAVRIRNGTMQLPSYPGVVIKVRQLMNTDADMREIAQVLAQDAAISAKLLRTANGAQFANLRKVDSVESALGRIGVVSACNIAEIVANRSLYTTRNAAYRPMLEGLWMHSVATAYACETMARLIGKESWRKMFSLGLLHGVGSLALIQAVAQADPEGKRIEGEENRLSFRAFIKANQAQVATSLMHQWKFHQDYHRIVRCHSAIREEDKGFRTLLIVNLANLIVRSMGYGWPLASITELYEAPSKYLLFGKDFEFDAVIEEVELGMEQTRKLLT